MALLGVYPSQKKSGDIYYRSSINFKNKHISLGSFSTEKEASYVYKEAKELLTNKNYFIEDYPEDDTYLSFDKWVVLINFRDNGIYIKNPIYIKHKYFLYYFEPQLAFKFDVDDLFYYSYHKIQRRGGYLFVNDFGSQTNILSRYGIKNFAVEGKDYTFANKDSTDYRYGNIIIINKYHGVSKMLRNSFPIYTAKIHVNGETIIGSYKTDKEAAVAYNKAADLLNKQGIKKDFPRNFIYEFNAIEYAKCYNMVRVSKGIRDFKL